MLVSEIGFGGSRIGGVFAGRNSSTETLHLLASALDAGINFYDTADIYSQGESEALIGKAFRNRRDQVVLATKGGYCLPARRNLLKKVKPLLRPLVNALGLKRAKMPAGLSGALSQNFSPSYLVAALNASLRRLRTDYVDLYQLHSPGAGFMQSSEFGEALQTLERLKTEGKIRHYGVATETPEEAPFCLAAPGISSLQTGFGLLDPHALDHGVISSAMERGLAVIARGCFGGGLLKEGLDEETLRRATPKWRQINALHRFSSDARRPLLDIALQFCRSTPGVSLTLIGMHTERHLRDSLEYAAGNGLDASEFATLRQLTAEAAAARFAN